MEEKNTTDGNASMQPTTACKVGDLNQELEDEDQLIPLMSLAQASASNNENSNIISNELLSERTNTMESRTHRDTAQTSQCNDNELLPAREGSVNVGFESNAVNDNNDTTLKMADNDIDASMSRKKISFRSLSQTFIKFCKIFNATFLTVLFLVQGICMFFKITGHHEICYIILSAIFGCFLFLAIVMEVLFCICSQFFKLTLYNASFILANFLVILLPYIFLKEFQVVLQC